MKAVPVIIVAPKCLKFAAFSKDLFATTFIKRCCPGVCSQNMNTIASTSEITALLVSNSYNFCVFLIVFMFSPNRFTSFQAPFVFLYLHEGLITWTLSNGFRRYKIHSLWSNWNSSFLVIHLLMSLWVIDCIGYTVSKGNLWSIINCKGSGRNQPWNILSYYSSFHNLYFSQSTLRRSN